MKPLATLFVIALTFWSLTGAALAKQTLPVTVSCTRTGPTSATVGVKVKSSATSLTVTVGGTGSVDMDKAIRHSESASKSQLISVPVSFTAGSTAGGLVVEVRGDFGHGMKSQIQAFTLVEDSDKASAKVRARTDGGGAESPDMVIVPARTSTEKR